MEVADIGFSLGCGPRAGRGGAGEPGLGGTGVSRRRRDAAGMAGMGTACARDARGWAEPWSRQALWGLWGLIILCFQSPTSPVGPRSHFWQGLPSLGLGTGRRVMPRMEPGPCPPVALCLPCCPVSPQLSRVPPAAPAPARDTGRLPRNHPTASLPALHPQPRGEDVCSQRAHRRAELVFHVNSR